MQGNMEPKVKILLLSLIACLLNVTVLYSVGTNRNQTSSVLKFGHFSLVYMFVKFTITELSIMIKHSFSNFYDIGTI